MKGVYLTKDGLEKLQSELHQLIDVDRKEIIKRIKEAREYGDLAENTEYEAAKEQQSMIEGRIEELEAILKNAKLLVEKKSSNGAVSLGNTVHVEIESERQTFTLVGSAESDPTEGRISDESPLGRALLGAKVGDIAKVEIPDGGTVEYKIVEIE